MVEKRRTVVVEEERLLLWAKILSIPFSLSPVAPIKTLLNSYSRKGLSSHIFTDYHGSN